MGRVEIDDSPFNLSAFQQTYSQRLPLVVYTFILKTQYNMAKILTHLNRYLGPLHSFNQIRITTLLNIDINPLEKRFLTNVTFVNIGRNPFMSTNFL